MNVVHKLSTSAIMLGHPNSLRDGDFQVQDLLPSQRGSVALRGNKKTTSKATMLAGRCSGNDALVRPERVELPTF